MRLFILFLSVLPFYGLSQQFSASELISLRTKTPGQIESTLINKGWELISTENGDYNDITISYSFGRSSFGDEAEAFFSFTYKNGTKPADAWDVNILSYQIHNVTIYRKLITQLNQLGYKEIDYVVKNGSTERHFRSGSGKTIALMTTSTQSSSSLSSRTTIYNLALWPPGLYKFYPKDEETSNFNDVSNENEYLTSLILDSLETDRKIKVGSQISVYKDCQILSHPHLGSGKVIGRVVDGKATYLQSGENGYVKIKHNGIVGYILAHSVINN
ncbi:hypothetical protein [Sphingobacterium sp.]|uniref:hypothetical protein n=1 Tax=Sphingobacterium sp. TaxID=341027 RepID=UPI00289987DE|nr:hypothetical protein [Sphingobacterium sp.]